MIQRIQTVYLLIVCVAMAVCAVLSTGIALVAIAAVTSLAALATIFLYKNRKQQMLCCRVLIALGFFFIVMAIANYTGQEAPTLGDCISMFALPVVAIIFSTLAFMGVRKDERLVRSLDRIR